MTDPFDLLRPEVREAVAAIDGGNGVFVESDDCIGNEKWKIVRAELLRLVDENAKLASWQCPFLDGSGLTGDDHGHQYCRKDEGLRKAEAELAALRARIAEAKRIRLGTYPAHGSGYVQIVVEPREGDQTYRLLVDEPKDDNAKEGPEC